MHRKNIIVRCLGRLARKFRSLQEIWILPWWGRGGLGATPAWTLDILVLIVKLFSSCAVATARLLIPPPMKSLHGETVLIVGAGHSIGRELAIQLAELGATIICWDHDSQRNDALVREIRKKDGECIGYTIDVTVQEQVVALALQMRQRLCDVSMVISDTGAMTCVPFTNLHPNAVAKIIQVHLMTHFWVIQAFLPGMINRRHGHIVAINSSTALTPCSDMVPYCAAKFGLRGLMESVSEELRLNTSTKNINVTSVYLGTAATGVYPPRLHRFTSWFPETTTQEAVRIIIKGIRNNRKTVCIPYYMKNLIIFLSLLPYRIRIIFTDFFNFGHRGWFCFC